MMARNFAALFSPCRPIRKTYRHEKMRVAPHLQLLEDRSVPSIVGTFELDGNASAGIFSPAPVPAGSSTTTSHDWNQVYTDSLPASDPNHTNNAAGTNDIHFSVPDAVNSAADRTFAGGSTKDTNDINVWQWGSGKPTTKADLEHGFAAGYLDDVGHAVLYVGADRYDNGGSSTIGVWFLNNPIGLSGNASSTSGTFINRNTNQPMHHAEGDLLFVANFGGSGSVPVITAFRWTNGALSAPFTLPASQGYAVVNNTALNGSQPPQLPGSNPPPVQWPFTSSARSPNNMTVQAGEFFELGLDLTQIFLDSGTAATTYSSFVIETRNSTSADSVLADFIIGSIASGNNARVAKVADNASVVAGSPVGYTVTVTNSGLGILDNLSLNDPLPRGAGNDLVWTIDSGVGNASLFQITTNVSGQQFLNFTPAASAAGMSVNTSVSVHVVSSNTTGADRGVLTNTVIVDASNEGPDHTDNTASASITITNRAPTAVNDGYITPFNTSRTVSSPGVLANDLDADLDTLAVTGNTNPSHGTVTINSNGSFTYTPTTGFAGPADTFTYTISDGHGGTFTATVTITIGQNHAPVANPDANSVTEDTPPNPVTGNVLTNDTDVDPATTLSVVGSFTGTRLGAYGTLVLNANGTYSYTLNNNLPMVQALAPGQTLSDSFSYQASDGSANSNTSQLTITVYGNNDAPVASADDATVTVNEGDTAANVGVFSDPDGDNVIVSASVGTIVQGSGASGDWSWRYTTFDGLVPAVPLTVTITATDLLGTFSTSTFTLIVNNVAPIISMSTTDITVSEGDGFVRYGSFVDPGLDSPWTATVNYGDGSGNQILPLSGHNFTLIHPYGKANAAGYVVTVTVTDKDGGSGSRQFTVHVNDVAPTVAPIPNQVVSSGELFSISPTFTDPGFVLPQSWTYSINWGSGPNNSGAVSSYTLGSPGTPSAGSFSGTHTYTVSSGKKSILTVTITFTDAEGNSGSTSFTVTVVKPQPVSGGIILENSITAKLNQEMGNSLGFQETMGTDNMDELLAAGKRRSPSLFALINLASSSQNLVVLNSGSRAFVSDDLEFVDSQSTDVGLSAPLDRNFRKRLGG